MTAVGITQRLLGPNEFGEDRNALDVRWSRFLGDCGLLAVPLPNDARLAVETVRELDLGGLVFSGGDDLPECGGKRTRRDAAEGSLLRYALARDLPVMGVCRGMQLIVSHFGGRLRPVTGHVAARREVRVGGVTRAVTCYHRWGCDRVPRPLLPTVVVDGLVEAVRLPGAPVAAMMWHPEREPGVSEADVELVREIFGGVA